jgi:hypothetical protein
VYNEINVLGKIDPALGYDWLASNEYRDFADACCPIEWECCLEVTKTVDPAVTKHGHSVDYEICVINCGVDCDLTLVSVIDNVLGDLTSLFSATLAAGVNECITYTYPVPDTEDTEIVNTVTATYLDITGVEWVQTATARIEILHPAFTVAKECITPEVPAGGMAQFEITFVNTGDTDLSITTDEPTMLGPFDLLEGQTIVEVVERECEPGHTEVCNEINALGIIHPDLGYDWLTTNEYRGFAEDCCECPGGDATRTPGFWKRHCEYSQMVLARLIAANGGNPIDLGWKTVATPEEMFGLFLAHKTRETDGDRRTPICHVQIKGTFHLLAAILTSGTPNGASSGTLIPEMVAAMAACDMEKIKDLHGLLDTFNNSGTDLDLGEPYGSADPECTEELADYEHADCEDCPTTSARVGVIPRESDPTRVDGDRTSEPGILESEIAIPREFSARAYPNPAGTSAMIRYALPMDSRVTVEILDVQGRSVTKLLDQQMPAGFHSVAWDSQGVPAGVYFCKVQCCDGKETISKVIKVQ